MTSPRPGWTTATTHDQEAPPAHRRLPPVLLALYLGLFAWSAVAPVDRGSWWVESALPLSTVALLAGMYPKWHLSDASLLCVFAFLVLHTVGAHYTYPEVPVGTWLRAWLPFGGGRNPYDRLVHLAFGLLLLYPVREVAMHHVWRRAAATVFAVLALSGLSGAYEVLEWGAARLLAPGAAERFVGAQGDRWDAQQDMGLAWAGSLVAAAWIAWRSRRRPMTPPRAMPGRNRRADDRARRRAGGRG